MTRQRDAIGLMAFDDQIVSLLPASARPGHLRAALVTLDRLALGKETNVSKPLHQLCDALTKRGMVVLISDLLDDPAGGVRRLEAVPARRRRDRRGADRAAPAKAGAGAPREVLRSQVAQARARGAHRKATSARAHPAVAARRRAAVARRRVRTAVLRIRCRLRLGRRDDG